MSALTGEDSGGSKMTRRYNFLRAKDEEKQNTNEERGGEIFRPRALQHFFITLRLVYFRTVCRVAIQRSLRSLLLFLLFLFVLVLFLVVVQRRSGKFVKLRSIGLGGGRLCLYGGARRQ